MFVHVSTSMCLCELLLVSGLCTCAGFVSAAFSDASTSNDPPIIKMYHKPRVSNNLKLDCSLVAA